MVVPRLARQALAGSPLTVYGDGTQTRCFTDVHDVVRALRMIFRLAQLPQRIVAWLEFLRGQHTHETMVRKPIGAQERPALTDGGSG